MSAHEHVWTELYRRVPWTVDDFDKDRLAPERARYALDHPDEEKRGQKHSDEDHYAKVALPMPEVVVKCYGCDTVEAIPIPKKAYKRLVEQLVSGALKDDDPANGNDLSRLPLDVLIPELKDTFEKFGLSGTGATVARHIGEEIVYSNLDGLAAIENDKRLRAQLGLPARDAADEAVIESSKKYLAEGKKASTGPAGASDEPKRKAAAEVEELLS